MQTRAKQILAGSLSLSALLCAVWVFPSFWYRPGESMGRGVWFSATNNLNGWQFEPMPIGKAAEKELVADEVINGKFVRSDGALVRAFAASSAKEAHTAAMFAHTPDRCWTAVGWKLRPAQPESLLMPVDGAVLHLERRVFEAGSQLELVYFGAFVGEAPFPQRLDQYLGFARRRSGIAKSGNVSESITDALTGNFLTWPWRIFRGRIPLAGAKQFFRISTPIRDAATDGDEILRDFLLTWLKASRS
jgi:hypothetical protein